MADVITQFKLETTQYDSKLRDAAKGLKSVVDVAKNASSSFTGFSQKSVEAARALGGVASGATTAKDKVKDLVGAYNDAANAYNKLSEHQRNSPFGKAMAESLMQLQVRIKEAKEELYGLSDAVDDVKSNSSGLFGEGGLTGMLQVTGGNLLASGITKLGSEIADTIQQSVELAKAGEGVRNAFERLNQPGLLDNLKEATHGTVSELELMKAAVKFDDFKLPVEELGTLLAFAQKKAKDTGQSVDYMVDSIVTGLGRKSLMILDNLGLSAAQIKEKMAETGDMTKAVAAIIQEEMAKAGDYVETAADRSARAAADAANQMEDIGRKAMPVAEEWAKAWNTIKIGGIDLLNTVFGPLARSAAQIQSILNGGGFKFKAGIPNLAEGPAPSPTRQPGQDHKVQAPGGYVEVTDKNTGAVIGGRHFDNLEDKNSIKDWQKTLLKTPKTGSTKTTPAQQAAKSIEAAEQEYARALEKAALEVQGGTISEAQQKQKQLAATEALWTAYGKASDTVGGTNTEYKKRQDELGQQIVSLGGETKSLQDAQKQAEEAYRLVAAQTQKMATAQEEANRAIGSGDLKAFYAADSKLTAAGGKSAATGMDMSQVFGATQANVDAFIANLKQRIADAPLGTDLYNNLTAQLADTQALSNLLQVAIKNGIDPAQIGLVPEEFWKKIFGDNPGDYINPETWQGIIDKMNEYLKDKGIQIGANLETGEVKEGKVEDDKTLEETAKVVSGLSQVASGLQSMGVKLPDGVQKFLGAAQGLMSIIQGVNTVISIFSTTSQTANTVAVTANTVTESTNTMALVALTTAVAANTAALGTNSAMQLIPFANGGIVHAANGWAGTVPGNSYSGDNIPIMANAGEVVLTHAMAGNLASQLNGGGMQNIQLEAVVTGEQILLASNNRGRRTGRGEIVQSRRAR